jgi:hypothetical protein
METSSTVPELADTAQAKAADILMDIQQAEGDDLIAITVTLELAAIDVYSAFESRMQHHFKRGPFSRKLKNKLLDAGKIDLAHRLHQYYLAINVLKHGTGASFRELRDDEGAMFVLRPIQDSVDEDVETVGLIDVTVAGFFEGLTQTILDAYNFLENK